MKLHQKRTVVSMAAVAILAALTLACGYGSKNYPPVAGTMPAISQLSPDSVSAGGEAFTLTVTGSNFGAKAVVNWNGGAQTTTYVSGTQLTATVPASLIMSSGTAMITVTNPAIAGTGMYGSGGTLAETSSAVSFSIN
ncbi:MAG TPA: IPT/TIG domain-containing protein [Verrucomicrobiae bacterium]|nr:IPT/TIG domain-containing protein [Verrucomicrobiae bacterium]